MADEVAQGVLAGTAGAQVRDDALRQHKERLGQLLAQFVELQGQTAEALTAGTAGGQVQRAAYVTERLGQAIAELAYVQREIASAVRPNGAGPCHEVMQIRLS
ncbi:hypothetical protein CDL15_Pgr018610 [Punica granatum]|nr:hypothetical protein CDL15_Pgr018610 [Punica granatum]